MRVRVMDMIAAKVKGYGQVEIMRRFIAALSANWIFTLRQTWIGIDRIRGRRLAGSLSGETTGKLVKVK